MQKRGSQPSLVGGWKKGRRERKSRVRTNPQQELFRQRKGKGSQAEGVAQEGTWVQGQVRRMSSLTPLSLSSHIQLRCLLTVQASLAQVNCFLLDNCTHPTGSCSHSSTLPTIGSLAAIEVLLKVNSDCTTPLFKTCWWFASTWNEIHTPALWDLLSNPASRSLLL